MSDKIYIAGLGIISAIGNNVQECLHALETGQAGMANAVFLHTVHAGEIPVAEVKLDNDALAERTGLPNKTGRTALLSMVAAEEALNDAGIEHIHTLRCGFISATTAAGIDKTEKFFTDILKGNGKGDLHDVLYHECGSITQVVADKLNITGYTTTINTACSSSANSIMLGARLIKAGMLDVAVAGGTDALAKFTFNGFNTLMILDKEFCRPFDENRNGLNLGEGAGYVVLVSDAVAQQLDKEMYCELRGYSNTNDAYHQTASSPDGVGSYLAMQQALQAAQLNTNDIDYINLHGTGTYNNDMAEGAAIQRLFEAPYPKMSSTKSFTGHTLGASGGIEAVFSSLAVKHGLIYPNLRLHAPMQEFPFTAETRFSKQPVKNVLSNSFGFGGNCSSLIFSKL
ncbi:beta-ketoacyl-[acyl-carrier-protein] synthase family protein [Parafilimonas sp.]|uniref:beta-ketoacyl-[acyl-carrier-protein] synthase family protein n=1 Tax=Parafilimonas sp. TaxID=1969739 RepID=UPI0039E22F4E